MRALAVAAVLSGGAGCDRLLGLNELTVGDARGAGDGARDATPGINLVVFAHTSGLNVASIDLPLTIGSPASYMLVTAAAARDSARTQPPPSVKSVTYASLPLTRIGSVVGVPSDAATLTEQWQLVSPPEGPDHVIVRLGAITETLHVSAIVFSGVDPVRPVRQMFGTSGMSTSSQFNLTSADGDLVVSVTGQGTGITAPTGTAVPVFIENVSGRNTLDNAAASTAPGASVVSVEWAYQALDNWQTFAVSLQPL